MRKRKWRIESRIQHRSQIHQRNGAVVDDFVCVTRQADVGVSRGQAGISGLCIFDQAAAGKNVAHFHVGGVGVQYGFNVRIVLVYYFRSLL